MNESAPIPAFPTRRSLHGNGGNERALQAALTQLKSAHREQGNPERHSEGYNVNVPVRRSFKERRMTLPLNVEQVHTGQANTGFLLRGHNTGQADVTQSGTSQANQAEEHEENQSRTPLLGVAVGSGAFAAPGESFTAVLSDAYSGVTESGFEESLTQTGLVPVIDVVEQGQPLEQATALKHHLFLVPDDVEPDEIEALAVSIWDDATWAMPGYLRLVGESYLRGPWRIDTQLAQELGLEHDLINAWVLETPSQRLGSVQRAERVKLQDTAVADVWVRAFPEGVPLGVEYKALLALVRMARRLGGALRIAGSGMLMRPLTQSAVNMAVYAPRWVSPDDMTRLLSQQFSGVIDSRDMTAQPVEADADNVRRVASVVAAVKPLDPKVVAVLQKAREDAVRQPQRVDGYALVVPFGQGTKFVVEVHRVMRPPRVLRWEPWTNGTIVEYRVRWIGPQGPHPLVGLMDFAPDEGDIQACVNAAKVVEDVTRLIVPITEGVAVDEDGFLVGFED